MSPAAPDTAALEVAVLWLRAYNDGEPVHPVTGEPDDAHADCNAVADYLEALIARRHRAEVARVVADRLGLTAGDPRVRAAVARALDATRTA